MLSSGQTRMIEPAKFAYFLYRKAFEKQKLKIKMKVKQK